MAWLHNMQVQLLPFDARTFAGRIAYPFTLLTIPAPAPCSSPAPPSGAHPDTLGSASNLAGNLRTLGSTRRPGSSTKTPRPAVAGSLGTDRSRHRLRLAVEVRPHEAKDP
ncbi:MAG: hypothetical protein M3460_05425 [Actinomycetota bacterium]|nr:hypothetical protein [Actinomycetota bacterium]